MNARLCADGVRRHVRAVGPCLQSSVERERVGHHRKPAHLRPKRTSKPKRENPLKALDIKAGTTFELDGETYTAAADAYSWFGARAAIPLTNGKVLTVRPADLPVAVKEGTT